MKRSLLIFAALCAASWTSVQAAQPTVDPVFASDVVDRYANHIYYGSGATGMALVVIDGNQRVFRSFGETRPGNNQKDPEKSLPRAINSIPLRIIMFYVFALIVIMSVTPWSSVVPSKSPFVELFVLVGLPAAASLINFVVLTSAASSANSGVFSTSRMLFGLAQDGQAPKMFAKLSKRAVPAKGLTFSCMCLLGGVVMLMVNPSVIAAFTMITTVSAILFMFVWTIILCSYLAYRKNRPQLHEKSSYKMPLGKVMCWVCMAFFVFVLVLLTLEDDTREALMVTPLWFVLLGAGWLFAGKKRLAK